MHPALLAGLAAGTLISEDATSLTAGLLARDGAIELLPAIAACTIGVYAGDLGLWALGRVAGRRALRWSWVARRVNEAFIETLGARLDARLGWSVLASRFLPGSRLPWYLAIGISSRRPLAFAAWSLLAVLLWTPTLVLVTYACGSSSSTLLLGELSSGLRYLVSTLVMWMAWRLISRVVFRACLAEPAES